MQKFFGTQTMALALTLVGVSCLVFAQTSTTKPTAAKAIRSLCDAGILEETSGRERDRTYCYANYLATLREGTQVE